MKKIRFEITDKAFEIAKGVVEKSGMTISEFARQAMLEKIEDEYDLQVLCQAMVEDDGVRIAHEELMKEFGL